MTFLYIVLATIRCITHPAPKASEFNVISFWFLGSGPDFRQNWMWVSYSSWNGMLQRQSNHWSNFKEMCPPTKRDYINCICNAIIKCWMNSIIITLIIPTYFIYNNECEGNASTSCSQPKPPNKLASLTTRLVAVDAVCSSMNVWVPRWVQNSIIHSIYNSWTLSSKRSKLVRTLSWKQLKEASPAHIVFKIQWSDGCNSADILAAHLTMELIWSPSH